MTELTLQANESAETGLDEHPSSVMEWQIHAVSNPADDATLDGCSCGCGCGCGCV